MFSCYRLRQGWLNLVSVGKTSEILATLERTYVLFPSIAQCTTSVLCTAVANKQMIFLATNTVLGAIAAATGTTYHVKASHLKTWKRYACILNHIWTSIDFCFQLTVLNSKCVPNRCNDFISQQLRANCAALQLLQISHLMKRAGVLTYTYTTFPFPRCLQRLHTVGCTCNRITHVRAATSEISLRPASCAPAIRPSATTIPTQSKART